MAKTEAKIEFGRSLDPRALNFWWNRHRRHAGGRNAKDPEGDKNRPDSKGHNKRGS